MTGKIIVIEGADCSGKTTIAERLASDVGGIYYHNPAGKTDLTKNFYAKVLKKSANESIGVVRLLQLASYAMNSIKMNELRESGHIVVVDRYLLSTVVYQEMELSAIQMIMETVGANGCPVDDAYLLTNSYETLVRRLNARSEKHDDWDRYLLRKGNLLINRYIDNAPIVFPGIKTIETDNKSLEDVYEVVLSDVMKGVNNNKR